MIADHTKLPRHGRTLAALATLGLAWLVFSGARSAPGDGLPTLEKLFTGRQQLQVAGGTVPAWEAAYREVLKRPVNIDLSGATLEQLGSMLHEVSELNVHVDDEMSAPLPMFDVHLMDRPLEEVLDTIVTLDDQLGWCLAHEAIFIGPRRRLPERVEPRFYNVTPLIDDVEDDDEREHMVEELEEALYEALDHPAWERSNTGIQSLLWQNTLVVSQTARAHDQIRSFLEDLLNRSTSPALLQARSDLYATLLERRGSVALEDADADALANALHDSFDVPVQFPAGEDLAVDLTLDDVSLGSALAWVQRSAGLTYELVGETLVFTRRPGIQLVVYDLQDLLPVSNDFDEREHAADEIMDLLMETVVPSSWEYSGTSLFIWRDRMAVRQSGAVHEHIAAFLASLRRVTRR